MTRADIDKQKLTEEEMAQARGGTGICPPILTIVPVPSLTIDEATVEFTMEVNNSPANEEARTNLPGETTFAWGKGKASLKKS